MANQLRNMVLSGVLMMLFAYLLIMFAIDIGSDYERNISELEGGKFNLTGINSTLQNMQNKGESLKEQFQQQDFLDIDVVTGMFSITISMFSYIVTPFILIYNMMINVFNIPVIIINVLVFILVIVFIFGVWSLMRKGD